MASDHEAGITVAAAGHARGQRRRGLAPLAGSASQLLGAVAEHAEWEPTGPALLGLSGETISYGELHRTLLEVIAQLRRAGLRASDRLVIAADPDLPGAIGSLAVLAGAVCVPVSGSWSAGELRDYLELVGPRAAVRTGPHATRVTEAAHALGIPAWELSLPAGGPALRAVPPDDRHGAVTPPAGRLCAQPGDALLLRTSGTTAAGKVVALTIAQVIAAARATVRAYHLGPADRRLNAMPLFHVQGLVGSLVASLCAGGSVVLLPRFDARQVLAALRSSASTWLSGTPTMHRALLDAMPPGFEVPASLRFVRCGSAALPEALRAEMSQRWRVPVIESYGMSEAHQIASTAVPPTVSASGMLASGCAVGVLGDDGTVRTARGSGPGELVLRGDNVTTHYAWPPGLEAAFIDGWLRTGDLGQIAQDGSVLVTGRLKELINSGGEKFSPAEVEAAIAAHPAVQDAAAFAVPDPIYGERAAAVVVARPGHALDEKDLLSFVARRLAPIKVPRRIVQKEAIPVGEAGKVVRSELAEHLAADLTAAQDAAGARIGTRPRTAVEATLAGIWATALDRAAAGVDDDFLALGGDSLSAVTLLSMVNEIFAVEISPLLLFDEVASISSMARWIETARAAARPAAAAPAQAEE